MSFERVRISIWCEKLILTKSSQVNWYLYLEPSKQLQTMKNTWRQTFVYQLLLDFNTSNLLFGGSQKSAYLCNAFLPRRILRAFILPSRGQGWQRLTRVYNSWQKNEREKSKEVTSFEKRDIVEWVDNGCQWLTKVHSVAVCKKLIVKPHKKESNEKDKKMCLLR